MPQHSRKNRIDSRLYWDGAIMNTGSGHLRAPRTRIIFLNRKTAASHVCPSIEKTVIRASSNERLINPRESLSLDMFLIYGRCSITALLNCVRAKDHWLGKNRNVRGKAWPRPRLRE